ncbi:MAG: hypothetical protein ACPLXS_02090 [Candidatus Micrarchaeales archaeon]
MKLNRFRYIGFFVMGKLESGQNFLLLREKFCELFGKVSLEESNIQLILQKQKFFVIKVNQVYEEKILIASCFLPLLSLFTTSSVKKSKEKIKILENSI